MLDKIAAGVALSLQTLGGFSLAVVTAQAATPGLDPALLSAYGAIGALFGLFVWSTKGRVERCEGREDKMLTTQSDQTVTMRELAAAVNKAADVTGDAVAATGAAAVEVKNVSSKLDTALATITKLENKLDNEMVSMRREIERLANINTKPS